MEYYFNNGKYIVPLDAVDESLMSLNSNFLNKMDSYKPLWSTKVLNLRNEKCYYQIELDEGLSESGFDTNNEESAAKGHVKLETYTCHVCNLEVPQYYMKDHVDSSRHKMHLKIAQVAVDRLIRNLEQGCYKRKQIKSLYFCNVCVCVVSINDKSRHLQSENHKHSVQKEAMFEKLLKFYTDGDGVLDEMFPDKHKKVDNRVNELNLKPISEHLVEVCSKLPSNKGLNNINKLSELNFANCVKILNAKTIHSHTLILIDNENYEIVLKNSCVVKVGKNNFHGIEWIYGRRYQCKLCSEVFKNAEIHILSDKHLEKVSLPIKDEHCIRDLDDSKSHCILCNELIESYLVHTLCNMKHSERLNNLFSISEYYFTTTTVAKTLPANLQKKTNFEAKLHQKPLKEVDFKADNNTKPEAKAWCKVCKVTHFHNDDIHVNCRKKVNKKYHFIKLSSQPGCYVCDVCFIQLNSQDVENHVFEPEHIDRCAAMLGDNNIHIVNENQLYCDLCGVIIEKGNEIAHIFSVRHVSLVQKFTSDVVEPSTHAFEKSSSKNCNDFKIDKKTDEKQNPNEYLCKICNVKLPYTIRNIIEHEKGVNHNKMFQSNDHVNKIIKKCANNTYINVQNKTFANNDSEVTKTCEINKAVKNEGVKKKLDAIVTSVPGDTKEDRRMNMTSALIPTNPKHVVKKTSEVLSKETEQPNQKANASLKYNNLFLNVIITEDNKAVCEFCKVVIPNCKSHINDHLIGKKHMTLVQKHVNNGLIIKDNMFYCQFCYVYILPDMGKTHINSEVHKKNIDEANL